VRELLDAAKPPKPRRRNTTDLAMRLAGFSGTPNLGDASANMGRGLANAPRSMDLRYALPPPPPKKNHKKNCIASFFVSAFVFVYVWVLLRMY
jgi:hypothetical protein